MFNSGVSLADIAAVTKNNEDGFGNGNGGWWVLIILLALCGGFNNGFGGNGNSAATRNDLCEEMNFNNLDAAVRSIQSGICSLGYDQLAQMNGINNNITQTGYSLQQAVNNSSVAAMQQFNALVQQLANCCCENRAGQAEIRNQMSTDTCTITRAITDVGRDIIDNNNCNYRSLDARLTSMEMAQKDATIAELRQQLADCNAASLAHNAADYVVNQVRPIPQPTFNVNNPWQWANNDGCGCCGRN